MKIRKEKRKAPKTNSDPLLQVKNVSYWFCKSGLNKSLLMKGDIAASSALGHSSCGRWPQPDIATSLCMAINHGKD
jgi:hypothetical protein